MSVSQRNSFRATFRVACVFVVTWMIGFWFYKYIIEDRDIGIVDYISIEDDDDFDLPMPYMCFETPVLINKMNSIDPSAYNSEYLRYLKGEIFDKRFKELEYEDITLKLENYFKNADIILFNGEVLSNKSREFTNKHIFSGVQVVENGIQMFLKCFEIKWNYEADKQSKRVKKILLTYNKSKLMKDLLVDTNTTFMIFIGMHYPGQFLQEIGEKTAAPMSKTYAQLILVTKGIEFLKRRNSHKRKCMQDWRNYDKSILFKEMKTKQCRAPYHGTNMHLRKCDNIQELRGAKIDFLEVREKYFPKPCHRISKADILYYGGSTINPGPEFKLILTYPEEIKVITQSKEIDFHALLGNIGSYIGLFLGRYIWNAMGGQAIGIYRNDYLHQLET